MAKKPTKVKLIELAYTYAGVIKDIATACDVDRKTVTRWKNKDPLFKQALEDGNDRLVDLALSGLKHLLEAKAERSVHYTLDRLARDKGFGQLIRIKDDKKFEDQFEGMSDKELLEYADKAHQKLING